MAQSKTTVPHFYVTTDADATEMLAARVELPPDPETQRRPSLTDLFVLAVARILREDRRFNSSYRDGAIEEYPRVHVAVAVATEETVVAPVLHDADFLSLQEISHKTTDLAARARVGNLTPSEIGGATFTVSNLGMLGVTSFAAVITPPQAASLALGGAREQLVLVNDGGVSVRKIVAMTLSCDHRVVSGHHAAMFLARLRELIEDPSSLLSAA
jgi:pyruvate dehydrogenase E2 component (dihydrolipoamide acetyltransferase)